MQLLAHVTWQEGGTFSELAFSVRHVGKKCLASRKMTGTWHMLHLCKKKSADLSVI